MNDTVEIVIGEEEFKIHFTIREYDPGDMETPPEEGGVEEIEKIYWFRGNKWTDITLLEDSGLFRIDWTEEVETELKNRM
tara:strand:+ start:2522 stop:2761 length:240 start_codon:yes stop_codon:yes gene_type:complete